MDGKCPWLGNLSSALVGSPNPCLVQCRGWNVRRRRSSRRWRLDSGWRRLGHLVQFCPLAILNYGLAWCRLRRLQTLLPTSTLVYRLRHHLLLGVSYDLPIIWNSLAVSHSKTSWSTVLFVTSKGRKMSKSLGNGLTRWMLSRNTVPMPFVGSFQTVLHQVKTCASLIEKMDASWNFINKIWNISRYILMNNEGLTLDASNLPMWKKLPTREAGNVTDRWILHNLNETIGKATDNFDKFEFGVAGHILYNFIWDEFADWYVELTKEVLYSDNEDEKSSHVLFSFTPWIKILASPSPNHAIRNRGNLWTNLWRNNRDSRIPNC